MLESYYVCVYQPAICFRDALSQVYWQSRDNAEMIDLLHLFAPAVRAIHDSGFMHGDMGNQNILLPRDAAGEWEQPQFNDLNRCTIAAPHKALTARQRGYHLSRIALPGDYLRIFKSIYCGHQPVPADLHRHKQHFRHRFFLHQTTHQLRHTLRSLQQRDRTSDRVADCSPARPPPPRPIYPPYQDIWLWDEKSAQPMATLSRQEKHRFRDKRQTPAAYWQDLRHAPQILRAYRALLEASYRQGIGLAGRIGVAMHPHADYIECDLQLHAALGKPPVLIRFCYRETRQHWATGLALVDRLHADGVAIVWSPSRRIGRRFSNPSARRPFSRR